MGKHITMSQKLKIYVERKAFQKYRYFIDLCEDEISGFGRVKRIGDKLVIVDFQIFKQTVSGAHSDMDDDALAAFLYEKTKAGESLSEWRVWWHSHASMAVFFSGTDTGTINTSTEFPWLISIVGNHAGDIKARFDIYDPVRVVNEEVEIVMYEAEDPDLLELCAKEIKEKVTKEKTYYPVGFQGNQNGNHQHNQNKKGKNKFWGGKTVQDMDDEDALDAIHSAYKGN